MHIYDISYIIEKSKELLTDIMCILSKYIKKSQIVLEISGLWLVKWPYLNLMALFLYSRRANVKDGLFTSCYFRTRKTNVHICLYTTK